MGRRVNFDVSRGDAGDLRENTQRPAFATTVALGARYPSSGLGLARARAKSNAGWVVGKGGKKRRGDDGDGGRVDERRRDRSYFPISAETHAANLPLSLPRAAPFGRFSRRARPYLNSSVLRSGARSLAGSLAGSLVPPHIPGDGGAACQACQRISRVVVIAAAPHVAARYIASRPPSFLSGELRCYPLLPPVFPPIHPLPSLSVVRSLCPSLSRRVGSCGRSCD